MCLIAPLDVGKEIQMEGHKFGDGLQPVVPHGRKGFLFGVKIQIRYMWKL